MSLAALTGGKEAEEKLQASMQLAKKVRKVFKHATLLHTDNLQ